MSHDSIRFQVKERGLYTTLHTGVPSIIYCLTFVGIPSLAQLTTRRTGTLRYNTPKNSSSSSAQVVLLLLNLFHAVAVAAAATFASGVPGKRTNIFMFLTVYCVAGHSHQPATPDDDHHHHQLIYRCWGVRRTDNPRSGIEFYSNFVVVRERLNDDHWPSSFVVIYKLRLLMSQRCDRSISSPGPKMIARWSYTKISTLWESRWHCFLFACAPLFKLYYFIPTVFG